MNGSADGENDKVVAPPVETTEVKAEETVIPVEVQADEPAETQNTTAEGSKRKKSQSKSRGKVLLSMLFFVSFLYGTYHFYLLIHRIITDPEMLPVSRVVIHGDLHYLTYDELADTIGRLAGGRNIVTLDLGTVHNQIVQLPWVSSAFISKKMPDTLIVSITEHYPSALWKSTGIYDAQSKSVFYPNLQKFSGALVRLSAPYDTLAPELYEHAYAFMHLLKNSPYTVEEVHLDASRGYRVRIQHGVWLILGRESSKNLPLQRLKRFMLAFAHTNLKLEEVSYVDLRYDNGFAVGEKEE